MLNEITRLAVSLVEEARKARCIVRLLGGTAVAARCQASFARASELVRIPNDIDLVGLRRERVQIENFLEGLNLIPNREFNLLSGADRLLYKLVTPEGVPVRVDVVLDRLEMCHVLLLAPRLDHHPLTISGTDLLLSKLQVMFPSESDARDTLALLATFDFQEIPHEPDHLELGYLCQLCGSDWGWHHTVTMNLRRVEAWLELIHDPEVRMIIHERVGILMEALVDCPKTWRWRLRDLVGERLGWYQIPEELVAE